MLLDNLTWLAVDSETTGTDPARDRLVEVAAVKYHGSRIVARFETFVDPGIPIPPDASGVHHIIDEDVAGAPSPANALAELAAFGESATLVVAHNAAFDQNFLVSLNPDRDRWLCTLRLAQHLLPDMPNHKLGTLRYALRLPVPRDISTHRAIGDAEVAGTLMIELAARYAGEPTIEALQAFAASPILVRKWHFGKFYGEELTAADTSYITWVLTKSDRATTDPDLAYSLNLILETRREAARAAATVLRTPIPHGAGR